MLMSYVWQNVKVEHSIYMKSNRQSPMTDQDTKDIFKLLPITSFKRECNFNNHLVRASHPQPTKLSDAGTYFMNAEIAKLVNLCQIEQAMHIKGLIGSYYVTEAFTCISTNTVYGTICKRCHVIYAGMVKSRVTLTSLSVSP